MELNKDLVAVVVGGASGMGAAAVEQLRAHGVHVALLDKNTELGNAVAMRTGASFFPVDVMDESSVVSAFESARRKQGQERVLIHTPGGGGLGSIAWRDPQTGIARRHDFARFERIVKLNLSGTFLCASIAAHGMLSLDIGPDGERGVIVMTSSTASIDGPAVTGAYAAAKAGINGLTLSIARDLAPEAIRVNTILPGNFETPLIKDVSEEYKANMRKWNLYPQRFGDPHEYASLALEIIRNRYFNAAQIRLDAGSRV